MTTEREQKIATVLGEFGAAFRGDWGQIDGRSIMRSLDDVAAMITGALAEPFTLERLRYHLDLCPTGGGHWTEYCHEDWVTCPPGDPS